MGNHNVNTTLQGALILSVAAFVAKLLSAVYRVPFQNMVGILDFMCISKCIHSMALA